MPHSARRGEATVGYWLFPPARLGAVSGSLSPAARACADRRYRGLEDSSVSAARECRSRRVADRVAVTHDVVREPAGPPVKASPQCTGS
jgi:hypothetical protein